MLGPAWREKLIDSIRWLFPGLEHSALYGMEHALAVGHMAQQIFSSLGGEAEEIDVIALQCAALLHDVGYSGRKPSWDLDAFEHVENGLQVSAGILATIPLFRDNPSLISKVLFLIRHHDDTGFTFPSFASGGKPRLTSNQTLDKAPLELRILKEADGRVHVSSECLGEAIIEWERAGLQFVPESGPILPSWSWHESILSNCRLVKRRSIIDTFSQSGIRLLPDTQYSMEHLLETECSSRGTACVPDICDLELRQAAADRRTPSQIDLQILQYSGPHQIEEILRSITLRYDKSLFPYRNARITANRYQLDAITPMALYVMKNRLDENTDLNDALLTKYAFALWELPGLLKFRYNSPEEQIIAPPVLELYEEQDIDTGGARQVLGLVDGLHRCFVARDLARKEVTALMISAVGFPLVPLPAKWDEVHVFENTPTASQKRRYRYQAWESVPLDVRNKFPGISSENFRYFFYRDLGPLGSKGERFV